MVTTAGPPTEINPGCRFAVDLFSQARLTKSAVELVFGTDAPGATAFEDLAEQQVVLCGASKRIAMKVTAIGRARISKALRDGRKKLKGQSEAAVFFGVINQSPSFGEPPNYFFWALQTGPVQIKLKGEGRKK